MAFAFATLSPFVAYLVTAWFLGSIIVNSDRVEPADGIVVYIDATGLHTDVFLPRRAENVDFFPWFREEHFMRYNRYGNYVCIGWGDRVFFEEVPYWFDLTPGIAARSALWPTPTLAHVSIWHSRQLAAAADFQRLVLSGDEYRRFCDRVRAGFQTGRDGLPIHVPHLTYLGWDAFFEGAGSYDGVDTCNQWAGEALRHAGVRMGLWTPFAAQVREALRSGKKE